MSVWQEPNWTISRQLHWKTWILSKYWYDDGRRKKIKIGVYERSETRNFTCTFRLYDRDVGLAARFTLLMSLVWKPARDLVCCLASLSKSTHSVNDDTRRHAICDEMRHGLNRIAFYKVKKCTASDVYFIWGRKQVRIWRSYGETNIIHRCIMNWYMYDMSHYIVNASGLDVFSVRSLRQSLFFHSIFLPFNTFTYLLSSNNAKLPILT